MRKYWAKKDCSNSSNISQYHNLRPPSRSVSPPCFSWFSLLCFLGEKWTQEKRNEGERVSPCECGWGLMMGRKRWFKGFYQRGFPFLDLYPHPQLLLPRVLPYHHIRTFESAIPPWTSPAFFKLFPRRSEQRRREMVWWWGWVRVFWRWEDGTAASLLRRLWLSWREKMRGIVWGVRRRIARGVTAFLVPATSPTCLICFSTFSNISIFASKSPPPFSYKIKPKHSINHSTRYKMGKPTIAYKLIGNQERAFAYHFDRIDTTNWGIFRAIDEKQNPRERERGESWSMFYHATILPLINLLQNYKIFIIHFDP